MFTIYALAHPTTGEVRYIGQTMRSLKRRVIEHVNEATRPRRRHDMPSTHWIRKHGKPEAIVLATVATKEMADVLERGWIKHTPNLLNLTEGGEGTPGAARSLENIEKFKKMARRPKSVEHRAKLTEAARLQAQKRGVTGTFVSATRPNRTPEEVRAAQREAARNRKPRAAATSEAKARMSAAQYLRWERKRQNDETRVA